ncbi:MAG: TetR family transcriptional regulator C-terminal domain-containing protein [Thermodesulfovibrionales bacterium]|jgi:TetR/AcrR family transcriptional repressor of nem operon
MACKDGRSAILEKGAQIIHRKGFNHSGIQEILDAAGVPKGSFYHYFKSKEDFGLNLLDHYATYFISRAESQMKDKKVPPIKRLKDFFEGFRFFFESNGCELGCPIGNLSQEMGDLSPAFRKRLEEIFLMMRSRIAGVLNEALRGGDLPGSLNANEMADFIVNSWEGAIVRMKVQKNTEALQLFDRMIFDSILKPTAIHNTGADSE